MITEIISLCIASYFINGCASQKYKGIAIKKKENKPPEPTVILDCSLKCLEKKKICPATEENGKKMVNACCISGDTLPDYVNPYITKWCNNREVKS